MPPKSARRVPDWSWINAKRNSVDEITIHEARRAAGLVEITGSCSRLGAYTAGSSRDSSYNGGDDKQPKTTSCTQKKCKSSARCYNHLGILKWVGDAAKVNYVEEKLGPEPTLRDVASGRQPAGLRNYGATCYANAFLQIWFNNVAFRNGVYSAVGEAVTPLRHLAHIFAMLQTSQREVVDPGPLIEALRLNKGDQQDAAEFSKLFMSLLDDQFKHHESLRNFVAEQFSGFLEYRTRCETCDYVSKTESAFLELEISLVDKSSLKSRVDHLLQAERLNGANKYRCPQCDSLQPAIRSTHLKTLPPTLHFSLMRFVYDPYTESRKKSRASITYPRELKLNGKQYALRGVVTHQGTSALHGHFTAEVYNESNGEWYYCSDEEVDVVRATGQPAKKRIKLDPDAVSDDSSKDAYMLVYRQVEDITALSPPNAILEAIAADNAAAMAEIEQRSSDRTRFEEEFESLSKIKTEVVDNIEGDGHVVALAALSHWVQASTPALDWDYSSVACTHGQIDPSAQEVRLISDAAFDKLKALHVAKLFPELDICRECVLEEYQTRHTLATKSEQVADFNELNQGVQDDEAYLLPKAWVKAWTSNKLPNGSLPTDDEYTLLCEHGGLAPYSSMKVTRATPAAVALLQSILGEFTVCKEKDELCKACTQQDEQDDIDYSAWRKQVKVEQQIAKAHLNIWQVFDSTNYILPRFFASTWRAYLKQPGPRPGKLWPELCQHNLLDFDPQLDEASYLTEAGWLKLCEIYGHNPALSVPVKFGSSPDAGKKYAVKDVGVGTCDACRRDRLSNFDKAWLPVVNGLDAKPTATGRTSKSRSKQVQVEVSKSTTVHDIKCDVYEELRITPKSQQLYLNGKKLKDEDTMESIGLLVGDHLNLEELEGVDDFGVSGLEGFGGSVLVGRKRECLRCVADGRLCCLYVLERADCCGL